MAESLPNLATLTDPYLPFLFKIALGHALATQSRPLVYGGGTRGIMGIISDSVLQHGGSVIAVVPDAMLRAGGEGEQSSTWGHIGHDKLEEKGRDKVGTVFDRRYRDTRMMFLYLSQKVESVSHIPCLVCSVNLKISVNFGLGEFRL